MKRLRHIAPSGAPIGAADLARWVGRLIDDGDGRTALTAALRARFGVSHAVLTGTGRAGMTVLLQALRRIAPARSEVVLPAYTCYSVAASTVKAGLTPRLVDIDPSTLDFDRTQLEALDASRVLAVIATNLYGFPNDLPALAEYARARGVFLIDDAAQAMGASVGGRLSGTWGDAGLFSFDKGKNVSAIDGGAVVTSDDRIRHALDAVLAAAPAPTRGASAVHAAKAVIYAALLHPWAYGVPANIPQLGLGRTAFTTDFPIETFDPLAAQLAVVMLGRLDAFTRARVANGEGLRRELDPAVDARAIAPIPSAQAVYLRLPVLVDDGVDRAALLRALVGAGIGATASYPASLADVPDLRGYLANPTAAVPGARRVARSIVTLPTHPFVTAGDRDTMSMPFLRPLLRCAA